MVLLPDLMAEKTINQKTRKSTMPQGSIIPAPAACCTPSRNPGLDKLDEAPEAHLSDATFGACLDMMYRILVRFWAIPETPNLRIGMLGMLQGL